MGKVKLHHHFLIQSLDEFLPFYEENLNLFVNPESDFKLLFVINQYFQIFFLRRIKFKQ